jgi:hypothetical protein
MTVRGKDTVGFVIASPSVSGELICDIHTLSVRSKSRSELPQPIETVAASALNLVDEWLFGWMRHDRSHLSAKHTAGT